MANQNDGVQGESWQGFSCPGCHTLFRVPPETKGRQVACPACGEIVVIPAGSEGSEGEVRFRTIAERQTAARSGRGGRRVRRQLKKKPKETPDKFGWENEGVPAAPLRGPGKRVVMAGVAAILIGSVGMAVLIVTQGEDSPERQGPALRVIGGGTKPPRAEGTELLDPAIGKVEMASTVAAIEAAVGAFLRARDPEELVRTVRGGAEMQARIMDYYSTRPFSETSYRDIAPNGRIMKSGDLWAVDVVLQDFTLRPIAVEKVEDRYLVDWESWVGYSEISWERFVSSRTTEPRLFRVLCSEVDYYNFDFTDDDEWVSYRLESPDHQHLLYGYVRRYSIQESMLTPVDRRMVKPAAFLVMLRFPEPATTSNQVLIEKVVASGWVTEAGPPPGLQAFE